jgi:hypothetical protein
MFGLLRRIEATRFTMKREKGPQKVLSSGSKGVRELRNLASSVNYEVKRSGSC